MRVEAQQPSVASSGVRLCFGRDEGDWKGSWPGDEGRPLWAELAPLATFPNETTRHTPTAKASAVGLISPVGRLRGTPSPSIKTLDQGTRVGGIMDGSDRGDYSRHDGKLDLPAVPVQHCLPNPVVGDRRRCPGLPTSPPHGAFDEDPGQPGKQDRPFHAGWQVHPRQRLCCTDPFGGLWS